MTGCHIRSTRTYVSGVWYRPMAVSGRGAGNSQSCEIRLLVNTTSGWKGYTYVWSEDQTDAAMTVPPDITTSEGTVHGNWSFPRRSECQACYVKAVEFVLSVSAQQLKGTHKCVEGPINQIAMLQTPGVFLAALPDGPDKLDCYSLRDARNSTTEDMARSCLDVNCTFDLSP
ncbi:MAG: hypothetical protein GY758_01255 [Fuerstiella sp.]|nr:hypothetical protein [Fuerstiella sp.]